MTNATEAPNEAAASSRHRKLRKHPTPPSGEQVFKALSIRIALAAVAIVVGVVLLFEAMFTR